MTDVAFGPVCHCGHLQVVHADLFSFDGLGACFAGMRSARVAPTKDSSISAQQNPAPPAAFISGPCSCPNFDFHGEAYVTRPEPMATPFP